VKFETVGQGQARFSPGAATDEKGNRLIVANRFEWLMFHIRLRLHHRGTPECAVAWHPQFLGQNSLSQSIRFIIA
jgi:hypothetical protein